MASILVADDEADIRSLLYVKLTRLNHRVVVVSNGPAALDQVRSNLMDLLILDVRMPGLSGLDVARAVRADPDIGFVPIILLSASASAEDESLGRAAGADDYVTKPFSPAELGRSVARLLVSHPARPGAPQPYP